MRRSHIGIYVFLSFIAGVWLRSLVVFDSMALYAVVGLCTVGAFVVWMVSDPCEFKEHAHHSVRMRLVVLLLGSLFLLFGWMRVESVLLLPCDEMSSGPPPITCINEQIEITTLRGTVVVEPDVRESGARYMIESSEYSGRALVFAPTFPTYGYGDILEVRCQYEAPEVFDGFDYPGFLAKDGVYSICRRPVLIEQADHHAFSLFTISGIRQRLLEAKGRFQDTLDTSMTSRESGLASSLVLGNRGAVSPDIQEQFRATGTSHVMAISGMHIMILTVLLYNIFYWLKVPRHKSFFAAIAILLVFIAIIGFRASGVRAVMFALSAMLGEVIHRPVKPLNLLLFVAASLLVLNPLLLVHDVGFQLSFLAVLGLTYLMPVIRTLLIKLPNPLQLRDILTMTLAAQLFTLPWLLYKFGTISLIAPVVNVLVLPVVPFVMAGGLITVLIGTISAQIAFLTGLITSGFAWYILAVVEQFARIPFAQSEGTWALWVVVVVYGIALTLLLSERVRTFIADSVIARMPRSGGRSNPQKLKDRFTAKRRFAMTDTNEATDRQEVFHKTYTLTELEAVELPDPKKPDSKKKQRDVLGIIKKHTRKIAKRLRPYIKPALFVLGVFAIAFIIWLLVPKSSHDLKVVFFDIGQGDSHLIMAPGGQNILIDGGPDDTVMSKLEQYLPLTDRTIDLMVLTHPHADHVSGLVDVLERYDVERVLSTGVVYPTDTYLKFLNTINEQGIQFDRAIAPLTYTFESDDEPVVLEVIYPFEDISEEAFDDVNESSVVLELSYYDHTILFTGDISVHNEQEILDAGVDVSADVLKVAHQGSDTSSLEEFLEVVAPIYAVIPVGENTYGHPSLRVVRRLERVDAQILRTDEQGDVVFTIDEEGLTLER